MAANRHREADVRDRAAQDGQGQVTERLRSEFENLLGVVGDRAVRSVRDSVGGMTDRLAEYADGGGSLAAALKGAGDVTRGKSLGRSLLGSGMTALKDKASNLLGGGTGGKGKGPKVTTILESVDVGVPVQVAYNQWTQFTDFPRFMKKVESVEQESDEKLNWKAQILWSHRSWQSTIQEQVPDDKIVWRSQGAKGYVDGAVTFHELAPNLTRVLMTLEYHPQGFFEHTGNLWRAQGRRARLELKHFQRHVMTDVIMHPQDVQGWRGVIQDGTVKEQRPARGQRPKGRHAGEEKGSSQKSRNRDSQSQDGSGRSKQRAARSGPQTRNGSTVPAQGSRSQQGTRRGGSPAADRSSAGTARRGPARGSR